MSLFNRIRDRVKGLGEGPERVVIADPRYDEWEVVREFEDIDTARAWQQALTDGGQESVLTSDWPLDQFRRGDINLQVPPGHWSDAEELLSNLDFD